MPKELPLSREQRYVQPDVAHVSVVTGFFAWALRQNRRGRNKRSPLSQNKVRLNRQSFGPDGIQAPTSDARKKAKFNNYFALGTGRDLRPKDYSHEWSVNRNRLVFLTVLTVVVVYSLVWITN